MRWLFRTFISIAFLGLLALAVWPHWPQLQMEARSIYETWQSIRQSTAPVTEADSEEADKPIANETQTTPRRSLSTPDTIQAIDHKEEDAFLSETRRRALEDPEAAMEWLQSQSSGSERLRGMLEVVALWAAEDSESALLWLESNAQGLTRIDALNTGVELWAESDPNTASQWIDGMANDGSKIAATKALASKWVVQSPEEATRWVNGLPSGAIRDEAASSLAAAWATIDPKAASIWAFSEAEFNGNDALLEETIKSFSQQDPDAAEAFIRDIVEAKGSPNAVAAHILGRAQQDPSGTAEWLSQLSPDDPIYSVDYANDLMQVWAETDSIAASTWLSEQTSGAQRDAAVYGFSQSIQRFEPEAAAAWANTIDDPERRLQRLTESVQSWARQQPVEALEWVKNAALSPALREQLASEIGAE